MQIKTLPLSLLQASQKLDETEDVIESCPSCGKDVGFVGSCTHTDGLKEDNLAALDIPAEDAPEEELSGTKEDVVINPEYKTFNRRSN
jgi:hypothetical protein